MDPSNKNKMPRPYEAKGDYYRDQASSYDSIRFSSFKGRLYADLQKRIIRKILSGLPKGLSVLDLPCGTGRISRVLSEYTSSIVCGDISQDMLAVARQNLAPVNNKVVYRELDAEKIDFPNDSFDLVATIKLMHLLPYEIQLRVLREIVRVSKRWVIVTYAYAGGMSWVKDYLFRKKFDEINPSSDYPRQVRDVIQECKENGCEVRGLYYTFRLFSSEVILFLEKRK